MQINQVDAGTLRRLAEMRPESGKVLSLYLNLDPTEFATPAARQTEIDSLLGEAEREAKNGGELTHDERTGLRSDVERVRRFFSTEFSAKGAHGMAIFSSAAADVFEAFKLPRTVSSAVVVDDSPFVEPLAGIASQDGWGFLLISRGIGRIFRGSAEWLVELSTIDGDVHRWHDQGGWSQARYQRGIEKETHDHVKEACTRLFRHFQRTPFQHLVIGSSEPALAEVEKELHPYLQERLAGHIQLDVEQATPEDILRLSADLIRRSEHEREHEALERLEAGVATGGRATAGLEEVLRTVNERRVETLMLEPGFSPSGVCCPQCDWVGPEGETCPLDGSKLEPVGSLSEIAIERTIAQSADVLIMRHHEGALEPRGSIAALLRY